MTWMFTNFLKADYTWSQFKSESAGGSYLNFEIICLHKYMQVYGIC